MTDAAIKDLRDVMATSQEDLDKLRDEADAEANAAGDYSEDDGRIIRTVRVHKKLRHEEMTNFTCRIVEDREISLGDDAPPDRKYLMRVYLRGKAPKEFEINASEFEMLNWVEPKIGSDALVDPDQKKFLPHAIKSLSQSAGIKHIRTIGHMGWARIKGVDAYVMPTGVIGPTGWTPPEGTNFAPPSFGKGHEITWPTQEHLAGIPAAHRAVAIEKTMELLKLGTPELGLALTTTPFRAILDSPSETALWLMGSTNSLKSGVCALVQQFWMPSATYNNPISTWTGTANAIERQAWASKDMALWVDDFRFNPANRAKLDAEGDRIVRSFESRIGRARLNRNSELMNARPPRGSLVVAGEDVITAPSGRTRLWLIEVLRGSIDRTAVEALSALGARKLFTVVAALFAQWLADNGLSKTRKAFHDDRQAIIKDMQDALTGSPLERQITAWADTKAIARVVQEFCIAHGRDPGLTDAYVDDCLAPTKTMTAADFEETRDGAMALAALGGVVNSRKGHIVSRKTGGTPFRLDAAAWVAAKALVPDPDADNKKGQALGWTYEGREWRPQGDQVGWIDEDYPDVIYIDLSAGYEAYAKAMRAQGRTPRQRERLGSELRAEGLLTDWNVETIANPKTGKSETKARNTIRIRTGPATLVRTWAVAFTSLFGDPNAP